MTKQIELNGRVTAHQIMQLVNKPGFKFYHNGGSWNMEYKGEHTQIYTKRLSGRPLQEWLVRANAFVAGCGKTKIVEVLLGQKDKDGNLPLVRIPVNTPLCCDPSSETYWSM